MRGYSNNRIGIYVRESRDDFGENYETIENQRDLLLHYVEAQKLGCVYAVYTDDNVSGSAFERKGLSRLKDDVRSGKINLLLLKDLSRLGRNNAKTLQFIDFLEEHGVRIMSSDGRYDSLKDNDTVGIETWINERYIRDISRKIRSCLRFKIQRGEYVGNAPFGYRKASGEKNRLCPEESEVETVRLIYRLYRLGYGYTSIASMLNERRCVPPQGELWNRITVRRILTSRVYIGDTVQGISEKVSFKSKKTRRLPENEWVITKGTHEGIISPEEFMEVQRIRESKTEGKAKRNSPVHILNGLLWCGGCGSKMYARRRSAGIAYVCGNYFRNGKSSCTSHLIYEDEIIKHIQNELLGLFSKGDYLPEIKRMLECRGELRSDSGEKRSRAEKQLAMLRRQQEILYTDRMENRITEQLFLRMNKRIEEKLSLVEREIERTRPDLSDSKYIEQIGNKIKRDLTRCELTNEMARMVVSGIAVYDDGDEMPFAKCSFTAFKPEIEQGMTIIDFIENK